MTYLKARETPVEIVEQSSMELILRKGYPRKIEAQRRIREVIRSIAYWLIGLVALSFFAPFLRQDFLDSLTALFSLNFEYFADLDHWFSGSIILVNLICIFCLCIFQLFRPFTEIWRFNSIDNQLTQTVQGALSQKVIRYSLTDITTIEFNESSDGDDGIAYEIRLGLAGKQKGLRLTATPYVMAQRDRAINRVQQREIANAIYQLLQTKNRQVTLQDNATGGNTIPKPVDWKAEMGTLKKGFQDVAKIGKAFKQGKKARKKGQLQLAEAYDRAMAAMKSVEANKNDKNAQEACDRAIQDLVQAAEATEKNPYL